MITSVRHTGLVVRDIEASLKLYRDLLGLAPFSGNVEEGEYIEKVTGIKGAKLKWVKLKAPDGNLLELLQYLAPRPAQEKPAPSPSDKLGCSHVAFTVKDIDSLYGTLLNNGYHCNSSPNVSPDKKAKVMYCHDADGIIVELVEELRC